MPKTLAFKLVRSRLKNIGDPDLPLDINEINLKSFKSNKAFVLIGNVSQDLINILNHPFIENNVKYFINKIFNGVMVLIYTILVHN